MEKFWHPKTNTTITDALCWLLRETSYFIKIKQQVTKGIILPTGLLFSDKFLSVGKISIRQGISNPPSPDPKAGTVCRRKFFHDMKVSKVI